MERAESATGPKRTRLLYEAKQYKIKFAQRHSEYQKYISKLIKTVYLISEIKWTDTHGLSGIEHHFTDSNEGMREGADSDAGDRLVNITEMKAGIYSVFQDELQTDQFRAQLEDLDRELDISKCGQNNTNPSGGFELPDVTETGGIPQQDNESIEQFRADVIREGLGEELYEELFQT